VNQPFLAILHLTERPGHGCLAPIGCQDEGTFFHNVIVGCCPDEWARKCGFQLFEALAGMVTPADKFLIFKSMQRGREARKVRDKLAVVGTKT